MITKLLVVLSLLAIALFQFVSPLINTVMAQEAVSVTRIERAVPLKETGHIALEKNLRLALPLTSIAITPHPLTTSTKSQVIEIEGVNEVKFPPIQIDMPDSAYSPDMKVFFEDMTFVQLLAEEYARIQTVCAGNGLNNIKPLPDRPMILIPNAGDLAVGGSNVAIQLKPDGEITFIPRVQGQRIRIPMDVGQKLAGWEVDRLTLAEAMQLMAADKLVWTARWFGPYGNGHGLPGHIAACDPRYPGS